MQNRILLALISISLITGCSHSHLHDSGHTHHAATALPTNTPDHIILTVTEDISNSVAVSWRTGTGVTSSEVELAIATHGPEFAESSRTVPATYSALTSTDIAAHYHTATLEDLVAGQTYVYRVGSKAGYSEWFQYTVPEPEAPFSFIYFGDAQNDVKSMWSRVIREAYRKLPKATFALHAGDLINMPRSDEEWHEWFGAGSFIHAMIPSISTPGNHEYRSGNLSPQWQPQFNFPLNGPKGHEETVYYFDLGEQCRVISLNSVTARKDDASAEAQAKWLEDVLKATSQPWIVVTLHHPLFATKPNRDNEILRTSFQELFEEYGVDLVLQGHDHAYGRGHNVPSGAQTVDETNKVVYVVSVSGPKMYDLEASEWMERKAKDTQLFQLISVNGNELSYEAYTARGDIYDAFDITVEQGKKSIVNRIPDMPERVD